MRDQVTAKINEMRLLHGSEIGESGTRAVVLVKPGWVTIDGQLKKLRSEDIGNLYLNQSMSSNLYSLVTLSHEIEHIIDVVKLKNKRLDRVRDSLRLSPFVLRTEKAAFEASYDFFEKLKAAGISSDDFIDLFLGQHPFLSKRQDEVKILLQKLKQTQYGPVWLKNYDELLDIVRLDTFDKNSYVNTRLNGYSDKIGEEQSAILQKWSAIAIAAGLAAYGGAKLDYKEAFEHFSISETTSIGSASLRLRSSDKSLYQSVPGLWDESYYQANGILLERDPALTTKCENPSAHRSDLYKIENTVAGMDLTVNYSAIGVNSTDVNGTTLMIVSPSGNPVFYKTTKSLVAGSSSVRIPSGAARGEYQIKMCSHMGNGTTVFSSKNFNLP